MPHPKAGRLGGLLTAILTPFDLSGGLALQYMPDLLEFQRQAGIDGVVVCGTNGEGTSLSVAERKQVLEAVMAHRGELLVVAATGAANVTDAVELTRHAGEIGADGALILPPFFFKQPTAAGLAAYFHPVLESADLPILLYNIPQFSAVAISDDLVELLAGHETLSGIKDSTGDRAGTAHFIERYPMLRIFPGSDRLAAFSVIHRAAGSISGGANAFPEVVASPRRVQGEGEEGIAAAQRRLDELIDISLRYPLIATSKSVLAQRGLPRLGVRAPLVNLSPTEEESLIAELRTAGFLSD